MTSITVLAPINIALIKYWGKAEHLPVATYLQEPDDDESHSSICLSLKNVPAHGSLSVSISTKHFGTKTRIELVVDGPSILVMNGIQHPINDRIRSMLEEVP